MSTQTAQDERQLLTDNDFELQLNLERAFAQLEGDGSNAFLLKDLEALALISQNLSIPNIAVQIGKNEDETRNYLLEARKRLWQYPPIQQCWEDMTTPEVKETSQNNPNWLDLFAGKSVSDVTPKMVHKTQIFRAALLSYANQPKNASEIPYPHILENVFTRLEAEGLLKPPKQSWLKKRLSKFMLSNHFPIIHWHHQFALVVFVFIVIIIPFSYHYDPVTPEPPESIDEPDMISKSIEPCLNELFEPQQPQTKADNLLKELKALGITATLTSIENGWRLESTLPTVRVLALDDLLERDDLIVLPTDYLCVDILSEQVEYRSSEK